MKKIIMVVGLACGALVADAINVTLDLTPPQSAWELRRKRTEDLQRLFNASNKIVKVEFDFAAGDVKVVYADAEGWQYPYLQRIQLPKKKAPAKIKPKTKEKTDVR